MHDETALPFSAFKEVLDFLPRCHHLRVMLLMAALTGCRLKELERMRWDDLIGNRLYWRLGKNQRGMRRVSLPEWFVRELVDYGDRFPTPKGLIFSKNADTLRHLFKRDVRPHLSAKWRERREKAGSHACWGEYYRLQLKGLRKSYATTIFYRHWRKYGDCTAGLLFAAAELCHSTKEMTATHYLRELDAVEIDAWDRFLRAEERPTTQARIVDYCLAKAEI